MTLLRETYTFAGDFARGQRAPTSLLYVEDFAKGQRTRVWSCVPTRSGGAIVRVGSFATGQATLLEDV